MSSTWENIASDKQFTEPLTHRISETQTVIQPKVLKWVHLILIVLVLPNHVAKSSHKSEFKFFTPQDKKALVETSILIILENSASEIKLQIINKCFNTDTLNICKCSLCV